MSSLDRKIMSLDRKIMSLDKEIISFDQKLISFDQKIMSLDQKLISIDQKIKERNERNENDLKNIMTLLEKYDILTINTSHIDTQSKNIISSFMILFEKDQYCCYKGEPILSFTPNSIEYICYVKNLNKFFFYTKHTHPVCDNISLLCYPNDNKQEIFEETDFIDISLKPELKYYDIFDVQTNILDNKLVLKFIDVDGIDLYMYIPEEKLSKIQNKDPK